MIYAVHEYKYDYQQPNARPMAEHGNSRAGEQSTNRGDLKLRKKYIFICFSLAFSFRVRQRWLICHLD